MNDKKYNQHAHLNTILFLAILCAGIILRVYKIGIHDLWYDEAFTVIRATNISRYIQTFHLLYQSPLYYFFMHLIISVFGNTEVVLRIPSLIPSILSIIIIYTIGKRHITHSAALISTGIMALSPFHIWYAQEARVYSISIFLNLFIFYLYLHILKSEKRRNRDFILLLILSMISFLFHYFSIFIIIPVFIHLLIKTTIGRKKILLYGIPLSILLFGPMFFVLPSQINAIKSSLWLTSPKLIYTVYTLSNFIFGYTVSEGLLITGFIITTILYIFLCVRLRKNRLLGMLLICSVLPVIIIYVVSQYIPVFLPRQLSLFSPFFILMTGWSMSLIRPKFLRYCVGFVIICICIAGIIQYQTMTLDENIYSHRGVLPKKAFKPIAEHINSHVTDKEKPLILHTDKFSLPTLLYYIEDIDHVFVTTEISDPNYVPTGHLRIAYKWEPLRLRDKKDYTWLKNGLTGYDSFWLVSTNWLRDGEVAPTSRDTKKLCMKILTEKPGNSFECDGIFIDHFVKRPE